MSRIELGLRPSGTWQSPGLPVGYFVGLLGIEPSLRAPKARVLPVYDSPTKHPTPRAAYYRYTTPRFQDHYNTIVHVKDIMDIRLVL